MSWETQREIRVASPEMKRVASRESVLIHVKVYHISSVIRRIMFLPKQSQRSRSVLKDGSRSLGLFRKGKIDIIAKFHRTDLVI